MNGRGFFSSLYSYQIREGAAGHFNLVITGYPLTQEWYSFFFVVHRLLFPKRPESGMEMPNLG